MLRKAECVYRNILAGHVDELDKLQNLAAAPVRAGQTPNPHRAPKVGGGTQGGGKALPVR
jgi:hypothetical protein